MRRYLLILILILSLPSLGQATDIRMASDDFNRANGGLGANWTTVTGTNNPTIRSNRVEPFTTNTTGSYALYTALAVWPDNQYSSLRLVTLNTSGSRIASAIVRGLTTERTGYRCDVSGPLGASTPIAIIRQVNNVSTTLQNTTLPVLSSDRVTCKASGTRISLEINGVEKLFATDSILARGNPGLFVGTNAGGPSDVQVDDWEAGLVLIRLSVIPRIPVGREAILDEYGVVIRDTENHPVLEETFRGFRIPVGRVGITDAEGRLLLDAAGYPVLDEVNNGPRLPRS